MSFSNSRENLNSQYFKIIDQFHNFLKNFIIVNSLKYRSIRYLEWYMDSRTFSLFLLHVLIKNRGLFLMWFKILFWNQFLNQHWRYSCCKQLACIFYLKLSFGHWYTYLAQGRCCISLNNEWIILELLSRC